MERGWLRRIRAGRARLLGVVLLGVLLLNVLSPGIAPVNRLRLAWFDVYQILVPRTRLSAPAIIVEIDDKSLAELGQWPWPRRLLARLVAVISAAKPAAIGIDIVMPEADRLSPDQLVRLAPDMDRDLAGRLAGLPSNDRILAGVLGGQPAVLGVAALPDREPTAGASPGRLPPVRAFGGDPLPFARRFEAVLRSVEELDAAAAGHGLMNFDPEGGVVRRLPLLAAVQGTLAPSLGLEMLRVASGEPALSVRADQGGIVAVGVGDVVIPTEGDGSVWIHYSPSDPDRFVSAVDVLSGKIEASRFARTLVLIAVTAVGLSDFQATPVADRMPGAEIHAQLLEGIVDGDLLSRPRWALAVEAALLVGLGLLLILVIPSRSVKISTVLLLLGMGAVVALGFLGYLRFRVLFDAATPAIGLAVLFSGMLGVTLAEADIQRRALRREVARQREAALKLAGELEAARRIQMGILPAPAAAFPGERRFDLFAFLEPARQVGGDLYDFFRLEGGRVFVLIGDVSGKGLPSSLFMALAKSFCKSIALRRTGDVGAVIREADAEISRDNAESLFVTVFAAVLDPRSGELQYCNAGHDPPYVLPVAGGLGRLDGPGGPPLCAVSDFPYAAVEHRLRPGDRVCFITDGVVDAENATGEFYGRKRLESLLGGLAPDAGAEEVGAAIRDDVGRFAAGVEASDDLAIVVLRWTPEAAGPG